MPLGLQLLQSCSRTNGSMQSGIESGLHNLL
jgi:hypothetical protein